MTEYFTENLNEALTMVEAADTLDFGVTLDNGICLEMSADGRKHPVVTWRLTVSNDLPTMEKIPGKDG